MAPEPKTTLTNLEALKVAYWHHVCGYPQHDLAAMFQINAGRVAEACKGALWYADNQKEAYKVATGKSKVVDNRE